MNVSLLSTLDVLLSDGHEAVLVTVAQTRGSAPREVGAAMVVTGDALHGTIGGGNLEFRATVMARELLQGESGAYPLSVRFPLSASLGQCCGGVVLLLFERLTIADHAWVAAARQQARASRPWQRKVQLDNEVWVHEYAPPPMHIALWGAGHVGQAIVTALSALPLAVTWIDPRPEAFPAHVPANVSVLLSDCPVSEVEALPAGTYHLVLTHSHALDFDLVQTLLTRTDAVHAPFIGLIGSATKRATFLARLRRRGLADNQLARITCPIGLPGIVGKAPAVIAASVASQMLMMHPAHAARSHSTPVASLTA